MSPVDQVSQFCRTNKIWMGYLGTVGGYAGFGVNRGMGVVYALGDPMDNVRWGYLSHEERSVGVALGGGAGLSLVVAWGFHQSEDISVGDDGSLNVDLDVGPAQWGSLSGYLKSVHDLNEKLKGAKHLRYAGKIAAFGEQYRERLPYIKMLLDALPVNPSQPSLISIPLTGMGLQIALGVKASITEGTSCAGRVNFNDPNSIAAHLGSL